MSAFDTQVDGNHYKDMAIQPTLYCHRNKLGTCESNIVKYASRHKAKGGRKDLEKVIHYAKLLIEMDYPEEDPELTYKEQRQALIEREKMLEMEQGRFFVPNWASPPQPFFNDLPIGGRGIIDTPTVMSDTSAGANVNDFDRFTTAVRKSRREQSAERHAAELSPSAQRGIEGCDVCE